MIAGAFGLFGVAAILAALAWAASKMDEQRGSNASLTGGEAVPLKR